jgi:glutamate-1-semialdehyde 2,1-aminomutase
MSSTHQAAITRPHRRQDELRARAVKSLPGGITRSTVFVPPHPPYVAKGAGARITDIEGHVAIDANNNYTSLIHGHAHPEITAVAIEAVKSGSAFGLPTQAEIELAERLQSRTNLEQWRFCNSGTEAVMMAIRCARAYTRRDIIVRFSGSYHGTSDSVVDVGAAGIPAVQKECVTVLPQGDAVAFESTMDQIGSRVAAVLIDLMPNRAGLVPADPEFVSLVRRRTAEHGALMIVDEVITFRVAFGGMSTRYGLRPDIMTVGKIIGGGFPAGGIGGSADVLRSFQPLAQSPVGWGGTFSANPVTMRAGCVALDLFDQSAVSALNAAGDALRKRLNDSGVAAAGSGSLLRLPLKGNDWWPLYDRGLLVGTNGLMALSTPMSASDLELVGNIVIKTLG